jgi:hypothetical protein
VFAGAWLVIICVRASAVHAVTLSPGDVVIGAEIGSTDTDYGLIVVDPVTGDRTILSDNTHGTGPTFSGTIPSVTFASDGSLLVGANGLMRVDPATGNRTIISSPSVGTGPYDQFTAARQVGSQIILSGGSLLNVDPTTGNRTQIPGASLTSTFAVYGFLPNGSDLIIANEAINSVERLDPITGTTIVISSNTVGSGPFVPQGKNLTDVEYGPSGNLYIGTTYAGAGIISVNPVTGDRTLVTGIGVGTGPFFGGDGGQIGVAADGTLYEGGFLASTLVQVDPATGNRTILSDATHGTGPLFKQLTAACAVVPNVPEPSTIILATLGGLAMLAYGRRKQTRARNSLARNKL